MIKLIAKPLAFIKAMWDLAFPMFSGSAAAREDNSAARWLARMILVAVILLLLALLNQSTFFGLTNVIRSPGLPALSRYWLPLFALCLYAMLWLGWWLYRVLSLDIEPPSSEFPDIDRAWGQAAQALAKADIHLDSVPLFLVLGWPSGSEDDFYRAAAFRSQVKQVPNDPGEPLHVTANRDGIWLTCAGASLLGQHHQRVDRPAAADESLATLAEESADPFRTMGMGAGGGETLRVEDFLETFKKAQAQLRSEARPKRVADPESHLARLRHLCRLIIRDRQGFCPINGVLLVLPIRAADSRADLDEIADACRRDLTTTFDVMRMRCPVLAMICGLEELTGFTDLVERLSGEQVRKRMGQRFPLVPELTSSEIPEKVESAVESVAGSLFPSMVHAMFQVESPGGEDPEEVLRTNSQLFRFLNEISDKGERLGRLVKECLPTLRGEPLMFGGCYFAATGPDSASQHAFASGVLARMIREDQDNVTWTEELLREDAAAARLARFFKLGFILIIALGVLTAAVLVATRIFGKPGAAGAAVAAQQPNDRPKAGGLRPVMAAVADRSWEHHPLDHWRKSSSVTFSV
jgi:hypothetical protein